MKPTIETIIKDYINLIYFFVKRWTNDQAVVDDIVQETFIKAFKAYKKYRFTDERHLKSWLLTIARNTMNDHFRMNTIQKDTSFDMDSLPADNDAESWLEEELRTEDMVRLKEAVKQLDTIDQEILELRFNEEFEFKEIANILNLTEGAVKMRVYRAITKLKTLL